MDEMDDKDIVIDKLIDDKTELYQELMKLERKIKRLEAKIRRMERDNE